MKRKIATLFISPPDGKKPFPHTIDTCASCGSNCWFNAEVPPDGHKMVCELVIWKDLRDCRTWLRGRKCRRRQSSDQQVQGEEYLESYSEYPIQPFKYLFFNKAS